MANLLDIYFEIFQLTNEMSEMKGRLLLNSIRHPNLILSYNITLFKCKTTCSRHIGTCLIQHYMRVYIYRSKCGIILPYLLTR
jgi:hypothetical protein